MQAGSKEEDFVGMLGGGAVLAVWLLINFKILSKIQYLHMEKSPW